MQPVVETVSGLERRVDLIVPTADTEKEVQAQLKQVARTAKVQGFRPGKAPLSLLERSHGPNIRYDVLNNELGKRFDDVVKEAELRVAGTPDIEANSDDTSEEQLAFKATFEVYPEVDVPDFSALEVTRTNIEVSDEDVQRTVDILRKQRADYEPREGREAQEGDRVTLDFTGRIDGEPFEGGSAEDFPFVLGEGRMLPEFEEAVQGMKAGETKTFPLEFPEDYGSETVAGKKAEFELTIKEVAEAVLPELNEEFARSLGEEDGSVEKLLADVKENIAREIKARKQARTKASVMDALVAATTFELPKALVHAEIHARIDNARQELAERGVPNADTMEIPHEAFQEEAERRVRLGLLIAEIVKTQELQASADQIKARVEEFAQNYEEPEQVVGYYMSEPQRRAEIEAIVLEDNVVEHVLASAKVTDEDVSFDELMGTN